MGFLDKLKEITQPYDDDEFDDEPVHQARTPDPQPARPRPSSAQDRNARNPFASSTDSSSFSNPFAEFETSSRPAASTASRRDSSSSAGSTGSTPFRSNNVLNINTTAQLQVVLAKPERFETAAEIADHLREKRTVVMNLEQTSKDVSRRLIDFLSGVAYAQDGKIKKVANSTYIITPYNVDLVGDLVDELENNGLYF